MTDQYAVFGNPISHSKSPDLQMAFARQTHQDMHYSKQEVALDGFKDAVKQFQKQGGKGLNITVPFKLEAFALADQLSERAQLANAVNTLIMTNDGKIHGDNTDGVGLVRDILETYGWQIKDKRVLILGAGGAVRGILGPLLAEKPQSVYLMNRTFSKACDLAGLFPQGAIEATEKVPNVPVDIIINGTSGSLKGQAFALPDVTLSDHCQCYDMMYGLEQTPFLYWAQQKGVKHRADGLGMLIHQGAESFRLWRGVTPNAVKVLNDLRNTLGSA